LIPGWQASKQVKVGKQGKPGEQGKRGKAGMVLMESADNQL